MYKEWKVPWREGKPKNATFLLFRKEWENSINWITSKYPITTGCDMTFMYFSDLCRFLQQTEAHESRINQMEKALRKLSALKEGQMVSGVWVSKIAKKALERGKKEP